MALELLWGVILKEVVTETFWSFPFLFRYSVLVET